MLSPLGHIAWLIRKRRRALGWTQRRVAAGLGCSQSYLAQVETGVRPVSRQVAERLERLLAVAPGSYRRVRFFMGRPRLAAPARAAIGQIRRSQGATPPAYPERLGRPRYGRADRVRGLVGQQLGRKMRGQDERFWSYFNSIRFQSKSERSLNLTLALHGPLVGISPQRLGCALPVVDGLRGELAGDRPAPAFVWQEGDLALACFPQRCVRVPGGYRWPDLLVIAARGGRRATGVVELDGAPYHTNAQAEAFRDRELGDKVLHLDAREASQREVVDRIVEWAGTLLAKESH